MVTLVDTKYYSAILRRARREQHLNMTDVAKMFRISRKEYRRYEHGKEPIPGMFQPLPCLGKVELGHHDDEHDDAKEEEHVLVFFLHAAFGVISP